MSRHLPTPATPAHRPWAGLAGAAAIILASPVAVTALDATHLILDLDSDHGVVSDEAGRVSQWSNQVAAAPGKDFVQRDQGRKEPGSGRPTLIRQVDAIGKHAAIDFRRQELVCMDEHAYAELSLGGGCTWFAVVSPHQQSPGLKDVHSFFGNLRNGGSFEGLWAGFKDDGTVWWGIRNGITAKGVRFDGNNDQVFGPVLVADTWHLVAGRLQTGAGQVHVEIFVDAATPAAVKDMPVRAEAKPNRLAVGQERDAVNHPGKESFDGCLARFVVYDTALSDAAMQRTCTELMTAYHLGAKP